MNIKKMIVSGAAASIMLGSIAFPALGAGNGNGFDQYGYNNNARNFVGTCLSWGEGKYGWTEAQAQSYCGVYSNDKLVMKWNKAWDDCNEAGNNDVDSCLGATLTNEWNGNVPGGSGETEHFKAIWIGSEGESSPYWQPGGYVIWGNYEALMDQGMDANHIRWVLAHATPNGFGASK